MDEKKLIMKLDPKITQLGITPEVITYLLHKSKHKEAIITEATLQHVDKNGVVCLGLNITNSFRDYVTLHIDIQKNIRTKRDLALNKLLEE
jgi:hypothetical protein